ncbi:hypothetical protein ACSQ67_008916 [Phaseolus vulgaris]
MEAAATATVLTPPSALSRPAVFLGRPSHSPSLPIFPSPLRRGMCDSCSPMIILLDDEADAFWCFERLMCRLSILVQISRC